MLADLLALLIRDPMLPAELLAGLSAGRGSCSVHGRRRGLADRILAGERLEMLPPLQVDPKLARQKRVATRRAGARLDRWKTGKGEKRGAEGAGTPRAGHDGPTRED